MEASQQVTLEQAMQIALQQQQAGRFDEAETVYRQILSVHPNLAPALQFMGVLMCQRGRNEESVLYLRRALAIQPDFPEALVNLAHVLCGFGQTDEAVQCCQKAIALRPEMLEAYTNLGSANFIAGRLEEAAESQRQALKVRPGDPDAYTNLGNTLQAMGRGEEAIAMHRQALAARPDFPGGYNNLGASLHAAGQTDEAIACYRKALALRPNYVEALSNLGYVLYIKGQHDEAIACCQRAIQIQPTAGEAYNNLGNALQAKGQMEKAIDCYKQAIALGPRSPDPVNNLGNCLYEQSRFEEALAMYQQALALRPTFSKAMANVSNTLRSLGRIDEAVEMCRKALALEPNYPEGYASLASGLHLGGQFEEAMAAVGQALALRPDFPEAHKDLALMLLTHGRFEEGWREYEWRLKLPRFFSFPKGFTKQLWDGSDLAGRTILVHAEQGFGDTLQFIRAVPLVQRQAGGVILECQAELKRLLDGCELLRGVQIVARASAELAAIEYDVYAMLMSLPLLLKRFDLGGSPDVPRPPYIEADEALRQQWREAMSGAGGFKIGLVWAGSSINRSDRMRSIPLALLEPLASPDITFYSLQFGKPAAEAARPPTGMTLIDLTARIKDFADTAAVIAELDLVLCVDTAVAHLAGAMGKPVWLLLPFIPDFRWMLGRDDTPLYPSMRLFRQTRSGDWTDVVERVATRLRERLER